MPSHPWETCLQKLYLLSVATHVIKHLQPLQLAFSVSVTDVQIAAFLRLFMIWTSIQMIKFPIPDDFAPGFMLQSGCSHFMP